MRTQAVAISFNKVSFVSMFPLAYKITKPAIPPQRSIKLLLICHRSQWCPLVRNVMMIKYLMPIHLFKKWA